MARRFAELDFLRGLCLLAMIFWHLAWDLQMYYGYPFRYDQGWMYWIAKAIVTGFMILAGISSFLTRNHQKRALRVLFFAMVITLVTFFYDRQQIILFGILHSMGVNMLLYPYYRSWPPGLIAGFGVGIIALGNVFANINMPTNLFFPLGLRSFIYRSLDYFPLVPYAGFFLIGTALGSVLYSGKSPKLELKIPFNPINYLGQHSLTVYVIHQPILLISLRLLAALGVLNSPM